MFINNLTDIIKTEILNGKYYICGLEKAKQLVLMGFSPISVDEQQNYIFYKNDVLMEFLRKGDIE